MNQTKAHIAALSLLDRALIAVTDDELIALMAGLPDDHVLAVKRISGLREADAPATVIEAADPTDVATVATGAANATATDGPAPSDSTDTADIADIADIADTSSDAEVVEAIRATAHKGRLNGDLQRLGVVLSDACLAECVEELGDAAELPTEADLQKVMPGLVDKHGVGVVRLMLASTVVGEAPASATIVGMLKNDELVKLPPAADKPLAPLLPLKQDDAERLALKAQRKERKANEQAAARLRREQLARAKNRV